MFVEFDVWSVVFALINTVLFAAIAILLFKVYRFLTSNKKGK